MPLLMQVWLAFAVTCKVRGAWTRGGVRSKVPPWGAQRRCTCAGSVTCSGWWREPVLHLQTCTSSTRRLGLGNEPTFEILGRIPCPILSRSQQCWIKYKDQAGDRAIQARCVTSLGHPSFLLVQPPQTAQCVDVAFRPVARRTEQYPVRDVVYSAVRPRDVVV